LKNILHGLVRQRKVRCHVIVFVKPKLHAFEVVWIQSPLVGSLYFLTNETVCISFIEMKSWSYLTFKTSMKIKAWLEICEYC
jgi:hypothetical protein